MRDDAPARALASRMAVDHPRVAPATKLISRRRRAIDACMALTDADPRSTTRSSQVVVSVAM